MVSFSLIPNPSPKEKGTVAGYQTADKSIYETLKNHSKQHRQEPTVEEEIIWQELRDNKLGFKIRRQHAIDIYIADFICLDKRTIIEIDGGYHNKPEQKELDELREIALKQKGYSILRFTNNEVRNDLQRVLSDIKTALENTPLFRRGGRG
ncbi:MAG: endonuclease domain-containing protein [Sphingobacteriales bacterium JAD_PAG50586_3]|nr:MAG: endonuclease domain-containing protein [Sphingobacteriales bacterium JAD_PAG50586_3]